MQTHASPPGDTSLADIADRITADACSAVTAADRRRGDRHGDSLDAAAVLLAAVDRSSRRWSWCCRPPSTTR